MRKPAVHHRRFTVMGGITALGVAAALSLAMPPAAGAQARGHHRGFTVVASHLNNPRGLSPAPGGGVYLAEAGSGGTVCVPGGEQGTTCVGKTGSFDLVSRWGVKRLVTGLISGSGPGGVAAEGPVSVSAGPYGKLYGLFGLSTHEVPPADVVPADLRAAALAELGRLVQVKPHSIRTVSDVGDQDWAWTSTRVHLAPKSFPDSNPNAVLYSHGHRYVADAGGNILVDVQPNGTAKVLAFFGVPAGSQSDSSVPTCVARGPDGALYVGELLGGFYSPGHARIWRVVPGHAPKVWATGLSAVQGCGFGPDGAFYATEFQVHGLNEDPGANPAGDVVRVDRWGHRIHLGVGKLFYPSGFAAGSDGAIYVSNCSIAPASGMGPKPCPIGGQVVRIG